MLSVERCGGEKGYEGTGKVMAELKPCPFCGGEATVYKAKGEVSVACIDCQCGTAYFGGASTIEAKIEAAVHDWNRRAEDGK